MYEGFQNTELLLYQQAMRFDKNDSRREFVEVPYLVVSFEVFFEKSLLKKSPE